MPNPLVMGDIVALLPSSEDVSTAIGVVAAPVNPALDLTSVAWFAPGRAAHWLTSVTQSALRLVTAMTWLGDANRPATTRFIRLGGVGSAYLIGADTFALQGNIGGTLVGGCNLAKITNAGVIGAPSAYGIIQTRRGRLMLAPAHQIRA